MTGQGDPEFEAALEEVRKQRPDAIGVAPRYDKKEARRIFAASDFTLMPSRFEPCGLSQMYAQRFGSLPIAHRTGGLAETIDDGSTGFLFSEPSTEALLGALCRAFATFGKKGQLNAMRKRAMAREFRWQHAAKAYRAIYKQAV